MNIGKFLRDNPGSGISPDGPRLLVEGKWFQDFVIVDRFGEILGYYRKALKEEDNELSRVE